MAAPRGFHRVHRPASIVRDPPDPTQTLGLHAATQRAARLPPAARLPTVRRCAKARFGQQKSLRCQRWSIAGRHHPCCFASQVQESLSAT
eukprot:3392406-Prymnesium_polylepis.1